MVSRLFVVVAVLCVGVARAVAQDDIVRARELYAAASYEEALDLLDNVQARTPGFAPPDIQQYRAFCLLALQRNDEAKQAIEMVYTADPMFRLDETATSPRVQATFREIRRNVLPSLAQRGYTSAKAAFDKKDPKATAAFDRVLALLDDPDMAGQALPDFRTVVTAFRDLSAVMAAPPTAPPAPATTPGNAPATSAAAKAAPAPPPAVVVPAVSITRPMPQWVPLNSADAREVFEGQVEVSIDAQGNVTAATISTPIYPMYDQQLVAYARRWKFAPATRNGTPIASIQVVPIRLQAQQPRQ